MLPHSQRRRRPAQGSSAAINRTQPSVIIPSFVTLPATLHSCIYAFVSPSTQLLVATTSHAFLDLWGCSLTTIVVSIGMHNKRTLTSLLKRQIKLEKLIAPWFGRQGAGGSNCERPPSLPPSYPSFSSSPVPRPTKVLAPMSCEITLSPFEALPQVKSDETPASLPAPLHKQSHILLRSFAPQLAPTGGRFPSNCKTQFLMPHRQHHQQPATANQSPTSASTRRHSPGHGFKDAP